MNGLTLPELLVTIAVGAIIMALAVPSFQESLVQNRLSTQINDLVLDLNFARSEAVKRGGPTVVLCKSTDGASCSKEADRDWGNGWIVFVDSNGDGAVDPGEKLRTRSPVLWGFTLQASANFANAITYRSTGVSTATGEFALCAGNDLTRARVVFINTVGRTYLGQDNNHNRKPEDENGNDITTCSP